MKLGGRTKHDLIIQPMKFQHLTVWKERTGGKFHRREDTQNI